MPDIIALNGTPDGALSAETLTRRIDILAGTGLVMQLNALVVERQLRIDAFPDDPVLAAQAREQQDRVKREAKNTLSRLMPDFLRVAAVSPAMAASLVAAVARHLSAGHGSSVAALTATIDKVTGYRQEAGSLAQDLTTKADAVKTSHASLSALIETQVTALDGPDGEIAGTLAKIEAARNAMAAALTAIVTGSNALGQAVQSLFVSVIGVFQTTAAAKPTAPAKPSPATAAPAKGSRVTLPTEPIEPFPVEGIGLVSQGVEAVTGAQSEFHASTAALVQLYQHFYRQKSVLAAVTALKVQVGLLETSLREAAGAAKAVEDAWLVVETGFRALRESEMNGVPTAQLGQQLAAEAGQTWKRLAAQAETIKAAFARVP